MSVINVNVFLIAPFFCLLYCYVPHQILVHMGNAYQNLGLRSHAINIHLLSARIPHIPILLCHPRFHDFTHKSSPTQRFSSATFIQIPSFSIYPSASTLSSFTAASLHSHSHSKALVRTSLFFLWLGLRMAIPNGPCATHLVPPRTMPPKFP